MPICRRSRRPGRWAAEISGSAAATPILVVTGPSGVGKSVISARVAASFERGVRLPIDDVEALIVSGHVPQSSASAGHQNHVVGGAVAAAAMQFAEGGYTTVIDGCIFPEVLPQFGQACRLHGVELHYAVLRAGFEVCLERAASRNEGWGFVTDPSELRLQWDRFTRLGDYDAHVLDASDAPAAVADRLLASFASGRLRVPAGG